MDFELSSTNFAALDKALAASGRREQVLALVSPEARAVFEKPHAARWYPGRLAVEAWKAILEVGGKPWLEELNYLLTRDSFGPIVGPLVKIGLTLSGSSPASVFAKLKDTTSIALRGVTLEWQPSTGNSGTQSFTYPCAMPADTIDAGWRGIFRVASELTGKPIRVDAFRALSDRRFQFDVSW